MEAADLDFGTDEDWEDVAAAIAADEERRSRDAARTASREMPVPELGSDGGAWRLASGAKLKGEVTSVEGRVVHATHSSACRECDRSGRGCRRCGGTGDHVRTVRLYTPGDVEAGMAYRRRREAARAADAAAALGATREANPGFFERVERLDARSRDPFVEQVMRTVERTGTLSQAQREVVEAKCARLSDLDDRRRRSRPVGEVGKMYESVVTCVSARVSHEVPFRKRAWRNPSKEPVWTMLYQDADGALLQERSGERQARPGDVLRVRGKVKAHGTYDGVARTFLSHARVLEVLRTSSPPEAARADPAPAEAPDVPEEDGPGAPGPGA